MRLIFGKMTMTHFMVFENETFDFSANTGMVMIRGKNNDTPDATNGTGKSTIGYALLYVLFGDTQDIEKNEYLVCRSAPDKNMKVTLEFKSDNTSYRVERGLTRGSTSSLTLYRVDPDPADLSKSTIAETQKFLEKEILMCDISIFLRTMLLSANQTYNFYRLKKQDKKDFVEKLFDIQSFGEMYKLMHKDLLQLDKQAVSKQNQMLILNRNVSDYRRRTSEFETGKAEKLADTVKKLDEAKRERSEFASKHVDVNTQAVQRFEYAIEKLDAAVADGRRETYELDQFISKIDGLKTKLNAIVAQHRQTLAKHADVVAKLCPDCVKVFNAHYSLDKAQAEIEIAARKLASYDIKRGETVSRRGEIEKKISLYAEKIQVAKQKIRDLTAAASEAQAQLNQIDRRIAALEHEKTSVENQANPYAALLTETETQVRNETDQTNRLIRKIDYLKFAETIVSQDTLRKFIIKDLIGILNNRIRKYLVKLGAQYYVVFDENMEYTFVPTTGKCGFGNFSGGEKMRLMIATSFAFRDFMSIRNGLNSNILILDEYFDSAIDTAGVLNLMTILGENSAETAQSIFVITHRPEVNPDLFDRLIVVEKTHDVGHITYPS